MGRGERGGKKRFRNRQRCLKRVGRVVLNPLTQVGVGMLVAVCIGRGQFVVDFQRDSEGRQRQQHAGQRQRQG